jgi:MYXO-CTERM domain-containing protein
LLPALVVLASTGALDAQEGTAVPGVELLTSASTDGGAIVEVKFVQQRYCDAIAQALSLAGPGGIVPLRATPYGLCGYAVAPDEPLSPGRYCLEVGELSSGPFVTIIGSSSCMEVTGVVADPSDATVVLGDAAQAATASTGHAPESCVACVDMPSDLACTRSGRTWLLPVSLQGVAGELSSTHLFAMLVTRERPGAAPPEPTDTDFAGLDSRLGRNLWLPIPQPPEQSCVHVHARPHAGGDHTLLGEACVQPDGTPSTAVFAYQAAAADCEPTYVERWCADNAECGAMDPSVVPACGAYERVCTADAAMAGQDGMPSAPAAGASGSGGGSSSAQAGGAAGPGAGEGDAVDPAGAGAAGGGAQQASPAADGAGPGGMSGCSVDAGGASPAGWALALLLTVLGRRRRIAR